MKFSTKLRPMNSYSSDLFAVPLTKIAHGYAQSFYREQGNLEMGKQIYLNTLAVYAVDYYLKCLGIATNLKDSDSWNPVTRNLVNVADLAVTNKGKLECCSVWSDAETCQLSHESSTDRIGYVVVWFNSDLTEAILLGFSQRVTGNKLQIDRLQPLIDLVPYLDSLVPELELQPFAGKGLMAKIRAILDESWESVEELLTQPNSDLAFGYRSNAEKTKIGYLATDVIDLQDKLPDLKVKLNIAVIPQSESGKVDLLAELVAESLPGNLYLTARESNGKTIISEVSERGDTNICLQLTREWEKPFDLVVSWEDFKYVKKWKGKLESSEI